MNSSIKLLLVFLCVPVCNGFSPARFVGRGRFTKMQLSSDGGAPKQSRLEGNTRNPSDEELALMDEMIGKLANAKVFELPNAVSFVLQGCVSLLIDGKRLLAGTGIQEFTV